MKRIARSAIVERSADEIYALVEDIERYPEFLPWCAAASVHERDEAKTVATIEIDLKGFRTSFTTHNRNTPGAAIEMELIEGPFKYFLAAWRFTALSATAAKIDFRLAYEFSTPVVAAALEPLFSRIADHMVDAFTHRALQQRA